MGRTTGGSLDTTSGRVVRALAAVVLAASVLGVGISTSERADAASTIYVAPWGRDGAAGTRQTPVKTVRHAVWKARSGDSIVLRGGVYRENVQIYGKAVAISSAPGERAVFDGARPLNGWQRSNEDFFVDGWTPEPPVRTYSPVSARAPEAGHPDQVFYNGRPLTQVLWRSQVEPGTFFHDRARDRIYIGDDPAGARVEASAIRWALYFNKADGSSLSNVTVRRFATSAWEIAAIRAHSNDLTISGVTSELNAGAGVSAIGSRIVIDESRFSDNGYLGVHAHRAQTLVIEDSAVVGNNKAAFDARHSAGGIKVTQSNGVTIRNNDVSRNAGPGIWTDLSTQYATVSYNRVEKNGRAGIEIELSSNVNVASNVTISNGEAGIWILESTDVQVVHNASYDNVRQIRVLEGPRRRVSNVAIRNNVVGNGKGGVALIQVDDWRHIRSAAQMGVRMDFNAFWTPRSSNARALSQWGDWPTRHHTNRSLANHRSRTGQGAQSIASQSGSNPYWRNPAGNDYRAPSSVKLGAAVTGSLAGELGVAPGTRLRIGPQAITPQR